MHHLTKMTVAGFACLAATACSSIPKKTFRIDALSTSEKPRPCLVVINGDIAAAKRAKQFINVTDDHAPLDIEIEFKSRVVKVVVIPVELTDGEVGEREAIDLPQSMPMTDIHNSRKLLANDVTLQLFIPK